MVIGDVVIGDEASVWYGCVLRGDGNSIRIGARTNVQDGTIIHVNHEREGAAGTRTWIGADITIGHMALIHACTLEDGCFVGMKACVMDGAVIESGAMVAARRPGDARQTGQDAASYGPAARPRLMRTLSEAELKYFAYSARHYCEMGGELSRDLIRRPARPVPIGDDLGHEFPLQHFDQRLR